MAVYLSKKSTCQTFTIDYSVLPAVRHPTVEFKPKERDDPQIVTFFIELRVKNIVQYTFFQFRISFKIREQIPRKSQTVDRNCIQTIQETIHIHPSCDRIELLPLNRFCIVLHEHRPICHVSDPNLFGGKMRCRMPQQKKSVKLRRRQHNFRPPNLDFPYSGLNIFIQLSLYIPV